MSSWLAMVVPMVQEPRWLSDEQQQAWLSYRRMTRQLEARLAQELARDSGLSMQDYDVLSALTAAAEYRLCAKDLGTHLLWSPSRLSHHLDRMERRDLVRRVGCPDGRGSDVVLTAQGLAAIQDAAPGHVEAVRQAFIDRIAPGDLATLGRVSASIIDGLREPFPAEPA
jgi:DNA-binding MarR family transcriptional regulator